MVGPTDGRTDGRMVMTSEYSMLHSAVYKQQYS